MKQSKPVLALVAFVLPLAVSVAFGYVDGDVRWGLLNGAVIGVVFAVLVLFGVFE